MEEVLYTLKVDKVQSAQIEQFALWSKVFQPWEWKLTIIYDKRRKYRDYQDLAQIHRRVTDEGRCVYLTLSSVMKVTTVVISIQHKHATCKSEMMSIWRQISNYWTYESNEKRCYIFSIPWWIE